MQHNQIQQNLARLRKALTEHRLAAWIAPSGDPHLGEFQPEHWALRKYLSGFTGSAGTLIVTKKKAALWTDSRYWEQAARQLKGSGITLMRDGNQETPSPKDWLCENLPEKSVVGADFRTLSSRDSWGYEERLARKDIALSHDPAIIGEVWTDRPAASLAPVRAFEYGGVSRRSKLGLIRKVMRSSGAAGILLSTLDDVAWTTNLRGSDIECTPVFTAFLLITELTAHLFIDSKKVPASVRKALAADQVECLPYERIWDDALSLVPQGGALWLDERRTCAHFVSQAQAAEWQIITGTQPTVPLKAHKTPLEIRLIRTAMQYDGVALCEFYCWLDHQLERGAMLTEWDLSEKLHAFRARSKHFIEESFTTIAAVDANAAEPHYTPSRDKNAPLARAQVLLIDSGGQYDCGTTDITRTVALREPEKALKRDYTAVLKGHIALASSLFPDGIFSGQLDTLARLPIWQIGADYGHGTGHGVGFHLSVHEGPVSISPRCPADDSTRVRPGVVVSNEPGIYRTGQWGIRIENLVTPKKVRGMLRFETLTLCPIDTRLIDLKSLSEQEIKWLNAYHGKVRETLSPLLSAKAKKWLEQKTSPV